MISVGYVVEKFKIQITADVILYAANSLQKFLYLTISHICMCILLQHFCYYNFFTINPMIALSFVRKKLLIRKKLKLSKNKVGHSEIKDVS